ncbi:uncharacterized protein PHALS_01703 [Plasmopara halstedii]|uniref:Uncharacterized protein n=1 Tax=Plasmopara halstedii TaxID=4781 RepID=A0A0P1AUM5_PLAHL|nr:uncharacterized protein PHALS_01703 [Plasmopara halstedii]CEG45404.1 hypothetical protein PHALS_01703 [Plasmopara halstedii]|eukprot:XP_024581773.1 hypothetical protein PHALS_01703 [Plasmopara halstedii]
MDDVTEFPALAQAKRLFLRRKYAARQHETGLHQQIKLPQGDENMSSKNPRSAQTNQQKQTRIDSDFGSRYSTTLESIFSDVDQHLQFISSNLVQINTMEKQLSLRLIYRFVAIALEAA